MEQQLAYCTTTDGVRIAYATYGNDEAPPLVYLPDLPCQEAIWASRWGRLFVQELARHRRLITLDFRGHGASQREADCSRAEPLRFDVSAVADQLRLDRFELLSGGWDPPSVMYAADHPERVAKLALFSPRAASSASLAGMVESVRASYPLFLRGLATLYFPSAGAEAQRWFSSAVRATVSADTFAATQSWTYDLAPILPQLTMPVLILHRKRSQVVDAAEVRSVASLIPSARLVILDGDVGAPYWDYAQFIDLLYNFLGIATHATVPVAATSGTAIILFTDIADSTALTERMGDAAFRSASRAIDSGVRDAIRAADGTPIEGKVLGDGVMGVFTSAADAISAARVCVDLAGKLPMHIGLHAGDVTSEGTNVYGGAVNIASRICALCAPGEILVSATVRDLARTSAGVTFEDRGEQMLKGIDDAVRVYSIRQESG